MSRTANGRRSLPPADGPSVTTRSSAGTWRERPRDLTGSAISPAATAVVAHATLAVVARRVTWGARHDSEGPSRSIVRFASAPSRRSASLRPRCAWLAALTARSANLVFAIVDGPTHALDARYPTALSSNPRRRLRFAQPPPHRLMRGTRIGGFRSRFALFISDTLWLTVRATRRPRIRRSIRSAR